jgi:hypothetical protein
MDIRAPEKSPHRLIAVVLGAPSSAARTGRAPQMFERGFASNPLSWLTPSLGIVNALVPIATDPPNLREEICGKHHHRPGVDDDDQCRQSDMRTPLALEKRYAICSARQRRYLVPAISATVVRLSRISDKLG